MLSLITFQFKYFFHATIIKCLYLLYTMWSCMITKSYFINATLFIILKFNDSNIYLYNSNCIIIFNEACFLTAMTFSY